jgi:hypothetical protein
MQQYADGRGLEHKLGLSEADNQLESEAKEYLPMLHGDRAPKPRSKKKRVRKRTRNPKNPKQRREGWQPEPRAVEKDNSPKDLQSKSPKRKKENKKKFPAISQVHFPELNNDMSMHEDVTYYIPHSMWHNEKTVSVLSKYHPCTLEDVHKHSSYNEHPLCAAFRSIAEAHCIARIQKEIKDHDMEGGIICDVGGSVNRHYNNGKRKYIHCCVPMFEAKDLMRAFSLKGDKYCRHMWEECDCDVFTASMSVHSLYYVDPEDILRKLLEQMIPVHYAVLHRYKGSGVMMHGEMEYISRSGKVKVSAKGNGQHYIHSDMSWLDQECYTSDRGTLVWEIDRRFEDVYIYRFVASDSHVQFKKFPEEKKEVPVEPEFDEVPYLDVIKSCIRIHSKIDAKSRQAFLARVERKGLSKGLDLETLAEMADEYFMNRKVVLAEATEETAYRAELHNKRLKFEMPSWRYRYFIILAIATCLKLLMLSLGSTLEDLGIIYNVIESVVTYDLVSGLVFDVLMFGVLMWYFRKYYGMRNYLRPLSLVNIGNKLRYRLLDYCAKDCKLRNLSKRKVIKYKHPNVDEEECKPGICAYPMVFHPDHVPYMPRRCAHNYHACIQHKILAETKEDVLFDVELPPELVEAAKLMDITPLSWEEWVTRFPAAKEKRLREEKEELDEKVFTDEDWNASSLFMKREFYCEIKPPRPIHASNVIFNYSVGRWLIPIGEALPHLLPEWICFPIHADSVEIGRFYDEYYENSQLATSDFSQYDSTQRSEALTLIVDFFRLCGVPNHVCDLMLLDTKHISVTTRKGFSYVCHGLRMSGRSETLLGNTVLTLSLFLHLTRDKINAILVKGDDAVLFLKEDVHDNVYSEIREGMDNLGFITKLAASDIFDVEFCSSYFIPCVVDGIETHVLTPKPGKMLAKTFWCKNTHMKLEEMRDQYVGILKGLIHNFGFLPYFQKLYESQLYTERFESVEQYRGMYNEYTDTEVQADYRTEIWLMEKYQLSREMLVELGEELSSNSFPIVLSCEASSRVITTDWGPANYSDLLVVTETPGEDRSLKISLFVLMEELLRIIFPVWFSLLAGTAESFFYGGFFNIFGHLMLEYLTQRYGIMVASLVHFGINTYSAGRKDLSVIELLEKLIIPTQQPMPRKNRDANSLRKKNRRRSQRKRVSRMQRDAEIISNPCFADIDHSLYASEEGIIQGFQTRVDIGSGNIGTSGYILWDPSFTSDGDSHINAVLFTTTDPDVAPLNTSADPFGSPLNGSSDPAGKGLVVGAGQWADSSAIVSGCRTISACIRATYYGAMQDAAGEVGYIENIPAETILDAGSGNPITVTELLQYCAKHERAGVDTMEVVWRPNSGSEYFRDTENGPITTASPAAVSERADMFGPRFCGFVFRDVSAISNWTFSFRQNIEWKPKAQSGLVQVTPVTLHDEGYVSRVLKYLDDNHPNWTTTLGSVASVTSRIAVAAFTGK